MRLANAGGCRDVSGTVIVQGGGNTAIDAAVTAKKLGAERAILCYRRSQREMPAWADEMVLAVQAGVEFLFQTQVLGVVERDGAVTGVTLAPVALGEADASGRRRPIVREDERYTREAAMVLTATGKSRGDGWADAFDAAKLFVGGDAANGGATVVQAVAEAKAPSRRSTKSSTHNREEAMALTVYKNAKYSRWTPMRRIMPPGI